MMFTQPTVYPTAYPTDEDGGARAGAGPSATPNLLETAPPAFPPFADRPAGSLDGLGDVTGPRGRRSGDRGRSKPVADLGQDTGLLVQGPLDAVEPIELIQLGQLDSVLDDRLVDLLHMAVDVGQLPTPR